MNNEFYQRLTFATSSLYAALISMLAGVVLAPIANYGGPVPTVMLVAIVIALMTFFMLRERTRSVGLQVQVGDQMVHVSWETLKQALLDAMMLGFVHDSLGQILNVDHPSGFLIAREVWTEGKTHPITVYPLQLGNNFLRKVRWTIDVDPAGVNKVHYDAPDSGERPGYLWAGKDHQAFSNISDITYMFAPNLPSLIIALGLLGGKTPPAVVEQKPPVPAVAKET